MLRRNTHTVKAQPTPLQAAAAVGAAEVLRYRLCADGTTAARARAQLSSTGEILGFRQLLCGAQGHNISRSARGKERAACGERTVGGGPGEGGGAIIDETGGASDVEGGLLALLLGDAVPGWVVAAGQHAIKGTCVVRSAFAGAVKAYYWTCWKHEAVGMSGLYGGMQLCVVSPQWRGGIGTLHRQRVRLAQRQIEGGDGDDDDSLV